MKFDNSSNTNTSTATNSSGKSKRRFPPYPPSHQFDTTSPSSTTKTGIRVSHDKSYIRNSTLAFIAKLKHEANVSSREIQRLDKLL